MIKIYRVGTTRSPVIVIGPFAFKFARNKKGRACNLYEAKLYRNVNATRRALLCPVLWVSRNGAVQIMRAAVPLAEMMSMEEYMEVDDIWDYMPGRMAPLSNRRHAIGVGSRAGELPWTIRSPPGRQMGSRSGWSREFDEPRPLPRGRQLVTLQDAGTYITKLSKSDAQAREWQTAMQALLLVVKQNGPTMFARIGMMRAINRNVERVFNPDRKDTHLGNRKLKRDQ